ncbi:VCBS domain-containing protein, partial [Vogesella indigofera]|uniref:VCBS domain-containing protein n=1 Tax=Vogesella indigofera TaxID=45465 RepID=UPI00234F76A5
DSNEQTLTITVTGTNDAPLAVAKLDAATEGGATINGQVQATDLDDDAVLSYSLTGAPAAGLTFHADGSYSFDPTVGAYDHLKAGVTQDVVVHFIANDGTADSNVQTLTITVTGTNDAPLAVAKLDAATEGGATINGQVQASDLDDDAVLSYSLTAPAPVGLTFNADGSYSFDPTVGAYDHLKAGVTQDVVVNFTANDGTADSNVQTLTITVTGTNDLASISGTASGAVQEATAALAGVPTTGGTLLLNDVDDGEAVFQQPDSLDGVYGSFTLDTGSGVWSYLLDNNRAATQALNSGTTVYDTLLVKSYDGTAQQTITVSIQGATDNSAPQFLSSGVLVSMFEHLLNSATNPTGFASALLGSVLASDADGNALSYSLLSDASGGAFQISAGGVVSVKDLSLLDYESAALIPGGGDARGYALEVAVSDGITAPVTTTLYIEVRDVNTVSASNSSDYIDGGSGIETVSAGGQADVIFGDGGNDILHGDNTTTGAEKADQLFGGAGNDQLFGNGDSDMLRGGSGNDALTGGAGSDTFVWSLADISGGPYTDTVKDWGAGGTADKLDLRDLLQGEHANALSLDAYLDFSYANGNTTIAVHSAGAGTAVTQSIVLESIQLAGADDQAIISNLLTSNKLVVDV